MAQSLLCQVSSEGVVPLFKYWVEEYLHGNWESSNLIDWNSSPMREEYVHYRLGNIQNQKKIYNIAQQEWRANKALHDQLSILGGCHFVTMFRDCTPSLTFVCDFYSPTRVVVMSLSTFTCMEFDRTSWIADFLSGVIDGEQSHLQRISLGGAPEDPISELWIH